MGQQRKYGLRNCSQSDREEETMHHQKLSAVTEKLQSHVDTFQHSVHMMAQARLLVSAWRMACITSWVLSPPLPRLSALLVLR